MLIIKLHYYIALDFTALWFIITITIIIFTNNTTNIAIITIITFTIIIKIGLTTILKKLNMYILI